MGRRPRVMLCSCCAVAAVMFTGGAMLASATPTSLAAHSTISAETVATTQATQWNLGGSNSIDVGYDGQNLVYTVSFMQSGGSLSGTLTDSYYPTSGPVSGSVSGDSVTFTFDYPGGSIQGTRTYTGTISSSGAVSGTWTQTGSESPDNGTWSLANNAVAGSGSPPPPSSSCTTATRTFNRDQASLNSLLRQLSAAQKRQGTEQAGVDALTQQVDADKAMIAKYKDLESVSDDDAQIVGQDIATLSNMAEEIKDRPRDTAGDAAKEEVETIDDDALEPIAKLSTRGFLPSSPGRRLRQLRARKPRRLAKLSPSPRKWRSPTSSTVLRSSP